MVSESKSLKLNQELIQSLERFTTDKDGVYETDIPDLRIIRSSQLTELEHTIYKPSICVVVQGAKRVIANKEIFIYSPSNYFVVTMDMPVQGGIFQAAPESPYLCMQLLFNSKQVIDIMKDSGQNWSTQEATSRCIFMNETNPLFLDAVVRLVQLLDAPDDISLLAPMRIREVLYRVLQDDKTHAVRQMALIWSHSHRISGVIERIKSDLASPLRISELASGANMSPSSLHYHFKQVTGMSPLQFQKQIRLQEARRLILSGADVGSAGFSVGYESPSQFSREYSRLFGMPPTSDMKRLRSVLQAK